MAESIQIVGSRTMDMFFQSYRSQNDFFDLPDFVYYCGTTIADIFQKEYKAKYAELRAFKSDDVVGFPADWLLEQNLKVENKDGILSAVLQEPIMSFSYDNQVVGVQDVLPLKPHDVELERSTIAEKWQLKYVPTISRVFWYVQGNRILFVQKGLCSVKEVTVLFIPAISDSMLVPDGIVKQVIDQTVATMKTIAQGNVVKSSLDGNQNEILQLEANTLPSK